MFESDEERNAALRNWAHGDRHCEAAVELLIDHGHWPAMLDKAGLVTRWGSSAKTFARPSLAEALERLDDPDEYELYASSSEERILELATSLVAGYKVSLSHLLVNLDAGNQRRVVEAVARAVGLVHSL